MFVRFNVQDYEAWKSVFDSRSDRRRIGGQKSYRVLRPENGSKEVDILFAWDSLDNARRYASSTELKETMQRAGVVGKREILFLEEAFRGQVPGQSSRLDSPEQFEALRIPSRVRRYLKWMTRVSELPVCETAAPLQGWTTRLVLTRTHPVRATRSESWWMYPKKESDTVNKKELIKLAFNGDGPEQGFYLSDNFQWSDSSGNPPMDKATFTAMGQPLQSSLPDLSVVIEDVREDGDDVVVASHYSGTFTNDLDLSAVGMGVIPATGKAIVLPTQRDRVTFDGDKIATIRNLETGPDAGIAGLIKALSADTG